MGTAIALLNDRPKRRKPRKSRCARARKIWSKEELKLLRTEAKAGRLVTKIRIAGRPRAGVSLKAYTLGIGSRVLRPWTDKENELLLKKRQKATCAADIRISGRSTGAIRAQLRLLEVPFPKAKPWTLEEDLQIKSQLREGVNRNELAIEGRSSRAARFRASKISPSKHHWTDAEVRLAKTLALSGVVLEEMVVGKRSTGSIRWKLNQVGSLFVTRADVAAQHQKRRPKRKTNRICRPWTEEEKCLLRTRVAEYREGKRKYVGLPDRTDASITYMLSVLKIRLAVWTKTEIRMLRGAFRQKTPLDQIHIPGKSRSAIAAKAYRLRLLKPRRRIKRWSEEEKQLLYKIADTGVIAAEMKRKGLFRDRTLHSMQQMLRRRRRSLEASVTATT